MNLYCVNVASIGRAIQVRVFWDMRQGEEYSQSFCCFTSTGSFFELLDALETYESHLPGVIWTMWMWPVLVE